MFVAVERQVQVAIRRVSRRNTITWLNKYLQTRKAWQSQSYLTFTSTLFTSLRRKRFHTNNSFPSKELYKTHGKRIYVEWNLVTTWAVCISLTLQMLTVFIAIHLVVEPRCMLRRCLQVIHKLPSWLSSPISHDTGANMTDYMRPLKSSGVFVL